MKKAKLLVLQKNSKSKDEMRMRMRMRMRRKIKSGKKREFYSNSKTKVSKKQT
jgi:hypothetical protein